MFCFRLFSPGRTGSLALGEAALTAGRAADNDLILDDPSIPEVAFRLTVEEEGCSLRSAASTAALVVNGRRVEAAFLKPGDRLEVGKLVLVLDRESAGAGDSPAGPHAPPSPGTGREGSFLDGLSRLCAMVAEERDLEALMGKLMGLLRETFGSDEAFLFTLDAAGSPEVFVSSRPGDDGRYFSDTVVTEALRTGKGLVIGNALADPAFAHAESITGLRLRSVLCCPITVAGRAGGLIYLGSSRPAVSFDAGALRRLEVYALVAGLLVDHLSYIARQGRVLASLRSEDGLPGVVAFCPPMRRVMEEIRAVAAGDIGVLLVGETGTGKDVMAQALHARSRRSGKPFLVVNCSTLRGELLASELFGHRKGAFTGAQSDHKGLFQAAEGGTLFLDEVGEMDLQLQAMLLRALETRKVRPVGRSEEVAVDVRIVSATNRDLEDMVAKGTFRQDLYYRLNQHAIRLPSLRERGEDILVLAHHFLEKARAVYPDRRIEGFRPDALAAMAAYPWPGNARELANVVHRSVLFSDSPLIGVSLPGYPSGAGKPAAAPGPDLAWPNFDDATRNFQQEYLQKALAHCGGDKEKAAGLLGIGRSTFFRYLSQARDAQGGRGPA
jgi:DNA-binding NtrC family response regulator